mgnify:FL=1|jgi:hypothetical protein|tara:strand:- start:180 stop:329 length:150 start_codon:yes stop_codon:yes gene_type:complete
MSFFMHHPFIPEDNKAPREAEANERPNVFIENIVRNVSELRPLSDREEV